MSCPPALPDADDSCGGLIRAARGGSREALGALLQRHRDYLLTVAREEVHGDYCAKGGASDLVQETFVDAQRDFPRFRGDSGDDLLRWLRGILKNNLVDFVRRYRTPARAIGLERPLSLVDELGEADDGMPAERRSPQELLIAEEQRRRLRAAIETLPLDYRRVIQLRHIAHASWAEVAEQLGRSTDAVQKLWARALRQLHQKMVEESA